MLADMFMSKLNLLSTSGHIINHSYNLQGFVGSTSERTMFYTPKKNDRIRIVFIDYKANLATGLIH